MNAKRSLLGLSFCTCYLASHLTNKVSGRVAATARGPGALPSTAPKLPRAGCLDGVGVETEPERKHSEPTSREDYLRGESGAEGEAHKALGFIPTTHLNPQHLGGGEWRIQGSRSSSAT